MTKPPPPSGFAFDDGISTASTTPYESVNATRGQTMPRADADVRPVIQHPVEVLRVYGDPGRRSNEYRVLVDRLWPRGRTKSSVDYDEWVKDAAPSTELRKWYQHDPELFAEFVRRYRDELATEPAAAIVRELRATRQLRCLVLLTATHDVDNSGAMVLRNVIEGINER